MSFVVKGFGSPITAMTRDVGDSGDLYPTPLAPTRIPEHLTEVIPSHRSLARVSAMSCFFPSRQKLAAKS